MLELFGSRVTRVGVDSRDVKIGLPGSTWITVEAGFIPLLSRSRLLVL